MNWEALGAVAELVGALGVIATLGYLAVQIRQNTAVVRTSSFQDLIAATSNFNTAIVQNAEVAEIYRRGIEGLADLSETEKVRFHGLMSELFNVAQVSYQLQKRGLIDDQLSNGYLTSFSNLLREPGVREWWLSARIWWHEDFQTFIDEKLRKPDA
jgi:hypothetical protein